MGDVVQLKYFPLSSSSQDTNDGSLTEISKMPNKSKRWISGRFCRYPQYLYIRFQYPVHLTQMNILIHEKKIPSRIDFYSYFPQTQTEFANTDYINLPYVNFGYIKFDTNERSSFLARECKKVFLDIDTYNLKLEIGKNYLNRYNLTKYGWFYSKGLILKDVNNPNSGYFTELDLTVFSPQRIFAFECKSYAGPKKITDKCTIRKKKGGTFDVYDQHSKHFMVLADQLKPFRI